jgi:tRNA-Thr(GGU) m(6)t(6)A37 methyltransferase TsaA
VKIELRPVGFVRASRSEVVDDFWGAEESCITLTKEFSGESLVGLTDFSHCEVLFFLSQVASGKIIDGARHPRNNEKWPKVGVFAQRTKNRPNRIGSTICRIVRVEGNQLFVSELDAIDGTPVIDIKPVLQEFLPRGEVRQPAWSHELMREYWLARNQRTG